MPTWLVLVACESQLLLLLIMCPQVAFAIAWCELPLEQVIVCNIGNTKLERLPCRFVQPVLQARGRTHVAPIVSLTVR